MYVISCQSLGVPVLPAGCRIEPEECFAGFQETRLEFIYTASSPKHSATCGEPLSIVSALSVLSNISVCAHVSTDLPVQCVSYALTRPCVIFGWFMWSKFLLRNSRTLLSGLLMLTCSCHQESVTINSRAHKYVDCNPLQRYKFSSYFGEMCISVKLHGGSVWSICVGFILGRLFWTDC